MAGQSVTSLKIVKEYLFPDGITLPKKNIEKITIDVSDLVSAQDSEKVIKSQHHAFLNLIKRVENTPFAMARPGTTLLAPNVSCKLVALKQVSSISPLMHSKKIFTIVFSFKNTRNFFKNIYILNTMRQEVDITKVDPLDGKWADLDFYELDDNPKPVWTTKCVSLS